LLLTLSSAINQKIAVRTIHKLGFRVAVAWNGTEALDYLAVAHEHPDKQPKPDLILMDIQMPVMDGYRCTQILRGESPYMEYAKGVPIVAMTASAIRGDKEKCLTVGMNDYLTKPIQIEALQRTLIRWSGSAASVSLRA
jgi:CheY-like chemotaxis protein